MSFSESGFVAAAVASWLGIDKQLPASASHGMLSYDATELHDSRRGEMVAKVIRNGKRVAVVYDPHSGQRYGAWGRSGERVANMLVDAWRALNTDQRNVLVNSGGRRELHRDPAEIVKRLSAGNDYASAIALAPFAGMTRRDVPVPTLVSDSGSSWRAEGIRKQAESAADYLVPELAKIRRKREREARIEAEKERARYRRVQERLAPYERAFYEAQEHLRRLQRGDFSVHTLLANCGVHDALGHMFKVTNPGRFPCSGGNASDQWPAPGEWTREVRPIACHSGWHLCTASGIVNWIKPGAPQELWIAEGEDTMPADSRHRDKVAYSRARLVRLIASGDLTAFGKPKADENALAVAHAAVEKARGEYELARQGY